MSDIKLKEIVQKYDENHDGVINLDEFCALMVGLAHEDREVNTRMGNLDRSLSVPGSAAEHWTAQVRSKRLRGSLFGVDENHFRDRRCSHALTSNAFWCVCSCVWYRHTDGCFSMHRRLWGRSMLLATTLGMLLLPLMRKMARSLTLKRYTAIRLADC